MLPGPDLILRLPKSKSLVRISTLASGNTFRATRWTDAYTDAPMMPHEPPLRVQPETGEIFIVSKCKQVAEISLQRTGGSLGGLFALEAGIADSSLLGSESLSGEDALQSGKWKNVPYADDPAPEHYIRALNDGLAPTPLRERELRICLWWLYNHSVRSTGRLTAPTKAYCANLEALRRLLHPEKPRSTQDRLLAVEIHRELGQFQAAEVLLDHPYGNKLRQIAERLRDLVRKRDRLVQKL